MKVLVFDTETTGLPPSRFPCSKNNIDKWPHVVQLSYIVYDTDSKKIVQEHDNIICLPEGIVIPPESETIHGISNSISKNRGIHMESALEIFCLCIKQSQCIVAHNIDFDLNMIDAECKRLHQTNPFTDEKMYYCTMNKTKDLCNLLRTYRNPGPNGVVRMETYLKKPTLKELHQHLFKRTPTGLHDSMVDVRVCLRCFLKVVYDETLDFTAAKLQWER